MGRQRFWIGVSILFSISLIEVMGNKAWGEEILVKGVPYIVQKAQQD